MTRSAVPAWLRARWRAFEESYVNDEMEAVSSPAGVLAACAAIGALVAAVAFLPPLSNVARLERPGIPLGVVGVAGLVSLIAWRQRCRGPLGTAATLLDTPLYSAALVYTSVASQPPVSLAVAALHAVMLLGAQAQHYALTALFALVVALPTAVLVPLLQPPLAVIVLLAGTVLVTWVVSYQTGLRRKLVHGKARLEQALDAAERVADESMQAALTTTLLNLGNFLHELRNAQTVVGTNLKVIQETNLTGEDAREALEDAIAGQQIQVELVHKTVRALREQASRRAAPFELEVALRAAVQGYEHLAAVDAKLNGFSVVGNPDYVGVIVKNLLRNAEQAGARRVEIMAQVEPRGDAARVVIRDDGPGMPDSVRSSLFSAFSDTTKAGGTGLGLYLVRRYTELLGGTVSLTQAAAEGAEFVLLMPGQWVESEPSATSARLH